MVGEYEPKASAKLISFDLDGTLIATKSGATFPKNKDDWKLWHESVPQKLKEFITQGFRVVIFTNQGGVGSGKVKPQDFIAKITAIREALQVPLLVLASTGEDNFRKPATGMWDHFHQHLNSGIMVDLSESYYVGDAAGRPASGKRKKDFSDSDLKFALNVGLKFQTPEQFFLGEKEKEDEKVAPSFDPRKVETTGALFKGEPADAKVVAEGQEVVIFVGPPAGGKSTFWQNYMPEYGRVNRDTLKTKEKCVAKMREFLGQKKSCVIDNTNPTKEDRKIFLDVAKEISTTCTYRLYRGPGQMFLVQHREECRSPHGHAEEDKHPSKAPFCPRRQNPHPHLLQEVRNA
jgi:bifunctional polynucleotide phosphatase/kinase